jgi:hypothetical protein
MGDHVYRGVHVEWCGEPVRTDEMCRTCWTTDMRQLVILLNGSPQIRTFCCRCLIDGGGRDG